MSIKEEYQKIVAELKYHSELYYTKDTSEISDAEYDILTRRAIELERQDPSIIDPTSPTQTVGVNAVNTNTIVKHEPPMLSLDNAMNEEERKTWLEKLPKGTKLSYEWKEDGLAIDLVFELGRLSQASTRMDGLVGEDITANAYTISNLPKTVPSTIPRLVIRGEVVMSKESFAYLNEQLPEDKRFVNARNAAAGSLRNSDPKKTVERRLSFIAYDVPTLEMLGTPINSHIERMELLKSWGFEIAMIGSVDADVDVVEKLFNKTEAARESYGYGVDGFVVKVDDAQVREELGTTARVPRWAMAFKFSPEQMRTKVNDIIFQVGRTGAITPVAILEPVFVGGVMVGRTTLHNQDELNRLGIFVGADVIVQRAGDVVPQLVRVLGEPTEGQEVVKFPEVCPACGAELTREEGDATWYCSEDTDECEGQLARKLEYLFSRQVLDIDGLGEVLIAKLVYDAEVCCVSDLYFVDSETGERTFKTSLEKIGLSDHMVNKLLTEVDKAKNTTFERAIMSLCIPDVGVGIAKRLAKHYMGATPMDCYNNLAKVTKEDLITIPDIGAVMANNIFHHLRFPSLSKPNASEPEWGVSLELEELKYCIELGLTWDCQDPKEKYQSPLFEGKTVVITGSFDGYSRDELTALLEVRGAKVTKSVSKKTNIVICGANAGKNQDKAKENNSFVITAPELPDYIELKTPSDWCKLLEVVILDPDGWDRSNYEVSWAQPLSRFEFAARTALSTTIINNKLIAPPHWAEHYHLVK